MHEADDQPGDAPADGDSVPPDEPLYVGDSADHTATRFVDPDRPGEPAPVEHVPIPREIGEYRVLALLGEGGMGVVYEAEQQNPRRRVALKVVRGGQFVDETRLRLFQREIDTLARLKHPNIGAIYESGCTADGQHFFAMELVRGETLDAYLSRLPGATDARDLEQRLLLFRKLADAVHYAHQRGVIHRDLKPSNIIVTGSPGRAHDHSSGDHAPEIKILDFGLARITDVDVPASTMLTEFGTIRGTLPYMSPEQTRADPSDIDVRTDVYTLGLILYEILTGARPYDTEMKSLVDAVRVICEEPPTPLKKSWSSRRRPDADLETILGKTLEKDPDRRYGSAAALSEDIGRYLASQPILARPPSAAYQIRKLVDRHKFGFASAVVLVLLLLGFGLGMSVLYTRAVAAEARAVEESETANRAMQFLVEMFETSDPSEAGGSTITAREILDRGAAKIEAELGDQPQVQARLMGTMGWVYRGLGLYDDAEPLLERALQNRRAELGPEHPKTLRSMNDLAVLYENRGLADQAERLHEEALRTQRTVLGPDHHDTLRSMSNLAVLYAKQGRLAESEQLYVEAIEIRRRVLGEDHRETLGSANNLAVLYLEQGRYEDAERLHRTTLDTRREVLGPDHPDTLRSLNNLAVLYLTQGRLSEAEPLYLRSLEGQRRVLGNDHPETLVSLYNLASVYLGQGRNEKAEPLFLDALERQRRVLGEDHPDTFDTLYNLACVSAQLGRTDRALEFLGQALDRGYTYGGNPAGILADPDLASLHDDPRFEAIARMIEQLGAE